MGFQIADKRFEFQRVGGGIMLTWESHVVPLIRCNIWDVRGRDLLIDTGLGIASLNQAARHLFEKKLTRVATHAHYDHVGGFHEFGERVIHRAEARKVAGENAASLSGAGKEDALLESIPAVGHDVPPGLCAAVPSDA